MYGRANKLDYARGSEHLLYPLALFPVHPHTTGSIPVCPSYLPLTSRAPLHGVFGIQPTSLRPIHQLTLIEGSSDALCLTRVS